MKKTSRLAVFWSLQDSSAPPPLALVTTVSTQALARDPIKIGVIAEAQAIAGASIPQAAQMAADEINAKAASMDARSNRHLRQPLLIGGFRSRLPAAPSMKTRSTSSSQAISAKSCWRWNRGPRA